MWGRRETSLAASQGPRGLAQLDGVCVRGVNAQELQLGELPAWLLFPSVPSCSGLCSGAFSALTAIGQSELLARGPSLPLAPRASPRGPR